MPADSALPMAPTSGPQGPSSQTHSPSPASFTTSVPVPLAHQHDGVLGAAREHQGASHAAAGHALGRDPAQVPWGAEYIYQSISIYLKLSLHSAQSYIYGMIYMTYRQHRPYDMSPGGQRRVRSAASASCASKIANTKTNPYGIYKSQAVLPTHINSRHTQAIQCTLQYDRHGRQMRTQTPTTSLIALQEFPP